MDFLPGEVAANDPKARKDGRKTATQQRVAAERIISSLNTLFVDCMVYRCSLLPSNMRSAFLKQIEVEWKGPRRDELFKHIRHRLSRLSATPCTTDEAKAHVDTLIKKIRRIDGRLLRDWVR